MQENIEIEEGTKEINVSNNTKGFRKLILEDSEIGNQESRDEGRDEVFDYSSNNVSDPK